MADEQAEICVRGAAVKDSGWKIAAVTVSAALVQTSFLAAWRPLGVTPNLLLALAVLAGLRGLTSRRLAAVLAGGVLLDLAGGAWFGFWSVALCLVTVAAGTAARAGFRLDNVWSAAVIVAVVTVLADLAILTPLILLGAKVQVGFVLAKLTAAALLNGLVTVWLWPIAQWATDGGRERHKAISL